MACEAAAVVPRSSKELPHTVLEDAVALQNDTAVGRHRILVGAHCMKPRAS